MTLKNLIYSVFVSLLLFSCKSDDKSNIKFEISGNLGFYESDDIFLQSDEQKAFKTLFIAEKENGNFHIKIKKILPINKYYLKVGSSLKRIPILIDNTDVNVYIDNIDLNNSYTKGASDYQKVYASYINNSKTSKNLFNTQKKFVEQNSNTELGAIVLKELLGKSKWRLDQSKSLYDGLAPLIQKSDLGQEIDMYITASLEKIKKEHSNTKNNTEEVILTKSNPPSEKADESDVTQLTEITEFAPYFYADNLNGAEVSSKKIFNKNRLTLIDFWASWCAPCRAQNPDLVRLYQKYHTKGFEILSISEDKDLNNWQVAVTVDKMSWLHVKDDYKRIANMYNVKAIPYTLLVDKQGGIMAKKISVNQLEKLLHNEFGY